MITKLKIDNFKSWQSTGEIKMSKLTGFFGTNSSGKTSLLQHLLLLKQTTESSDRNQVLDFGDEKSYVQLGTFNDIIYSHEQERELNFSLGWELKKPLKIADPEKKNALLFKSNQLEFKAGIRQLTQGRAFVEAFSYEFDKYRFQMEKMEIKENAYGINVESVPSNPNSGGFEFKRIRGRSWDLPAPVKFYGFPDQTKAYFQNTGFLSDFQLELEELFSRVYYLGPLREYPRRHYIWAGAQPPDMGRRGEKVIDAILGSRERGEKISRGAGRGKTKLTVEKYVAYWLKELALVDSFRVDRMIAGGNLYQVLLKINRHSPEAVITDVGFGVSQILPVITLCYYVPKGSILIIEQPEIHLHPFVQAGLADVFIDAVKTRDIQIILESHSEHLLRRLQRRTAEENFDSTHASLFFCANERGESKLNKLEMNTYGQITNWPKGFFGDEMGELAATSQAIYKRKTGA